MAWLKTVKPKNLETASNMERSRKPPRIPWATTRHLKNSFKFSVQLSIHNTHFTLYTIHREKTLQLLYARPGCQVRGAHYILPREEHQRHHGHQLESTNQVPQPSLEWKSSFSLVPNRIFHLHAASDEEQLPRAHFRHIFNHHIAEWGKMKRQIKC